MKKEFFDEFIHGGHLLSLGGAGITVVTMLFLGIRVTFLGFLVPYLVLQIVYNFNHIYEAREDLHTNPERATHLLKSKLPIFFLTLYFLSLLVSLLFLSPTLSIITLVYTTLGIAYTLVFKRISVKITAFKNLATAFLWSSFLVVFGILWGDGIDWMFLLLGFLFFFLRFLLNTVFFDIKDVESDRRHGLKTIPALFGIARTSIFLHTINIISGIVLIVGIYFEYFPTVAVSLILFMVYGLFFLMFSRNITSKTLRMISYVFVDGESILMLLVVHIASWLFHLYV